MVVFFKRQKSGQNVIAVITVEPTFQRCYLQCARKGGFRVKRKYLNKESSGLLTCGLFSSFVFADLVVHLAWFCREKHGKARIAYGCVNRNNKPECSKLSWHSLPINNAKLLRTWLLKMKRKDPPVSKHSYLCSEHFSEDCFMRCVGGKRYLKSGSVPTRFSFSLEEKSKRKAPVYRSAARKTTKHQVKDEVILNPQSNPVDKLVELESVNIPGQ